MSLQLLTRFLRHSSYSRLNKSIQSKIACLYPNKGFRTCCIYADKKSSSSNERPPELDNWPGKEFTNEWKIKTKGKIYDNKPFKFRCEKDKVYKWCACGLSKNQPFCDNSHDGPIMRSILRPVTFIAPETKDYWFCNCKQTNHRPLCDGTHKDPKIQEAIKS